MHLINRMTTLEEIYIQAFQEEENGDYKKGIKVLEEALKYNSEWYADLLYELGMMYFRNGLYYLALIKLIERYHSFKSVEVLDFIFEAYVYPNQEIYLNNYNNNKRLLENYPLIYSNSLPDNFENIDLKLVWYDEDCIIYYINEKFIELKCKKYSMKESNKADSLLLINGFCMDNILDVEQNNLNKVVIYSEHLYSMNPLFLYYEFSDFIVFLFIHNVKPLLDKERIIFLLGKDSFDVCFENLFIVLPSYVWNVEDKQVISKIKEIMERRIYRENYLSKEGKQNLISYYNQQKNLIIEHIKSGKPKILFITSRYTSALQYHAMNLFRAAVKKGLNAQVLIEKTCVEILSETTVIHGIEQFKPDIIVLMDHFRFEMLQDVLLKEVIFLTWVQDPMAVIMDKTTPAKLIENDFLLNHYISWKDFFDIGYDKSKIIDAPIPANQDIYKPYVLTEEEKNNYGCDICMVSHYSVICDFIEKELNLYDGNVKEIIKNLYLSYYKQVLEREEILYSKQQYKEYINQYFMKEYHNIEETEEEAVDILVNKMYGEYGPKVYRQAMVEWILSAGYRNIKLWGCGWEAYEKFSPYAMGEAGNGEELSKILQASKIVIGNNGLCTGAARVWETMLSGGFYLSNYVPEEYDVIDFRKILEEEDFVMFKSKSELLEKIDYYLNHEEERVKMAKRGQDKAMEKMTFDILMDRILKYLKEKL